MIKRKQYPNHHVYEMEIAPFFLANPLGKNHIFPIRMYALGRYLAVE